MKLGFESYMRYFKSNESIGEVVKIGHLESNWEGISRKLNDYTHNNGNILEPLDLDERTRISALWTSHKDFIGYYNPLTKLMKKSNKDVFDILSLLNNEYGRDLSFDPFSAIVHPLLVVCCLKAIFIDKFMPAWQHYDMITYILLYFGDHTHFLDAVYFWVSPLKQKNLLRLRRDFYSSNIF